MGVEIRNYKSDDKIFLTFRNVKILNGGSNYDVITPPSITLSGLINLCFLAQHT